MRTDASGSVPLAGGVRLFDAFSGELVGGGDRWLAAETVCGFGAPLALPQRPVTAPPRAGAAFKGGAEAG